MLKLERTARRKLADGAEEVKDYKELYLHMLEVAKAAGFESLTDAITKARTLKEYREELLDCIDENGDYTKHPNSAIFFFGVRVRDRAKKHLRKDILEEVKEMIHYLEFKADDNISFDYLNSKKLLYKLNELEEVLS